MIRDWYRDGAAFNGAFHHHVRSALPVKYKPVGFQYRAHLTA
jgi:hypothetical protein